MYCRKETPKGKGAVHTVEVRERMTSPDHDAKIATQDTSGPEGINHRHTCHPPTPALFGGLETKDVTVESIPTTRDHIISHSKRDLAKVIK